ncbi:mobilization protein [Plectonema radiosum NIES-515]|uniref:Mobilization protein n=1 Tax=Plectonema radiosum NIES-515 TaxID=2986073 RepID=A0ABT3B2G0_9CYAN|nr:mobilization protein [Plectonema radiosum]MCV3215566.1 mobilization protein [Plectonema radiosum NIES-515]
MPRVKKTEPMDKPVEQLKLENPKTSQPLAEAKEHQEHQEYRAATSVIPISELNAENGSKEALVNPKTPTKIHLIDGEKGGVGKSLFARTLMQYCIDTGKSVTLVDADRTNADVSEVYPNKAKTASFSENEKKSYDADEIFNLALTQSVVVNLPAQVYLLVNEWISRNSVLEVGVQYDVRLVKWFVCTGAYDSVKLFIESLDKFKDTITHVLVKNYAMCDEWERVLEKPELKSAIAKYKVQEVVFPKLSFRERDILLEEKLTFAAAKNYTQKLGVLGTQRVHSFLKQAHGELDKVGLLP